MARKREFEWRPGRFEDVVLYVATALADDSTFGSTKLNKILYFSDTDAYKRLGQPITGAEYQKNRYGPTAREFPPLIGELENRGYITVHRKQVVDHMQEVITLTGLVEPNMEQFSSGERAILDAVIGEFRGYDNTMASDESHKRSAGWLTRETGESIPYRSSLIDPEPLDAPALAGLRTQSTT